jgi:hypothetical protein
MAAHLLYRFESIAPGATTSLFIHGYSDREASNYSLVLHNQSSPTQLFAQAHATVTQGETFRWSVDGTIGRKIYVTNHQALASIGVDVLEIKESY